MILCPVPGSSSGIVLDEHRAKGMLLVWRAKKKAKKEQRKVRLYSRTNSIAGLSTIVDIVVEVLCFELSSLLS